jgi:hypothetical protein
MEDETEEYVESTEISPEEISPEERAVEPPERALCRALNGPVSRRRLPRWLLGTALRCRLPPLPLPMSPAHGSYASKLGSYASKLGSYSASFQGSGSLEARLEARLPSEDLESAWSGRRSSLECVVLGTRVVLGTWSGRKSSLEERSERAPLAANPSDCESN